jgi:hypothetical protein
LNPAGSYVNPAGSHTSLQWTATDDDDETFREDSKGRFKHDPRCTAVALHENEPNRLMETHKHTHGLPTPTRESPAPGMPIRTGRDARRVLAPLLDDEQALTAFAAEFFRLGSGTAGRAADPDERAAVYRSYLDRILSHLTARDGTAEERRDAVSRMLEEMREENLRRHSTVEAHRAHVDVESHRSELDDLRALYEPPDGRTRAEHASFLNGVSQEARDAYERGATLYGDVLVIPRASAGKATGADQVRAGSHAHAVREFTPLVGEERAKEVATEFVELGRAIAGRTADGGTRLVVFQTFYNEIAFDAATGKMRPIVGQAAQLEPVLERMRVLAIAMRAEEWKPERGESIEFGEWEETREARQRDAEHETNGRLTYRIESIPGLEPEHDELEELARDRTQDEREAYGGRVPSVEYERVRLDRMPPPLPAGLSEEDARRLRYEIIPSIDRRLEGGARPRDIASWLYGEQRSEEARARDEEVARALSRRDPETNREHPLTRAEELSAIYVLQTLTADETIRTTRGFDEQLSKIAEEIARIHPTERERAEAIDAVGAGLARSYRAERSRLKAFEAAEAERDRLAAEAREHEASVRAGAEFQELLFEARAQERENTLTEREALIRGNNARYHDSQDEDGRRGIPGYPELSGGFPTLSPYALLQQEHEQERRRARTTLVEKLISPDMERERDANFAELEKHQNYISRVTGREITSASEAREAVEPRLERVRGVILRMADERAQIKIETPRAPQKPVAPILVGLGANGSLLLPVENTNEYNTLVKLTRRLDLGLRVYDSPHGREITGEQEERTALYNFARDYVRFRGQDDVTRLKNEKKLFREYGARLDRAQTLAQLRETISDIRRDNYARATRPEQFAEELRDAARRSEQLRRPLTTGEMRQLFLAPAPEHYTAEMRELRLSRAETGRDRQQHIRDLERGTRELSPELATLLREFDRTRHDSPLSHSRNVRAFLGDYLNPPDPNRNRFSRENLYELGKRLRPAERDYLFRVIDSTKRVLEQREAFSQMRGQMEAKVAGYLTGVVREHGVESLERDGAHHTDSVSRLVNETLQEHGYDLAAFNLNDDQVKRITGRLVEELPIAIRAVSSEREQQRTHEHQLGDIVRRDALLPAQVRDDSTVFHAQMSDNRDNQFARRQAAPSRILYPDDEFVEQKVNKTIGQLHQQAIAVTSTSIRFEHHQQPPKVAHELSVDNREQYVHGRTLIR